MLAEKYSYKSSWELEREEHIRLQREKEEQRRKSREQAKQDRNLLLRKYVSITSVLVLATYGAVVFRSEAFASAGRELVIMKQQEKALRANIDELKIEVEELKGPNRIIRLAEQNLGMHVSRENIYVVAK